MKVPVPGLTIPVAVVVVLAALLIVGLRIVPAPFGKLDARMDLDPALAPGPVETVPMPAGLPAPVERFYRTVYGDRIPVITSVVLTGRAEIRPFGWPTFEARFRFTHVTGRSYRHYIEATFFGLPLMKVNEGYVDGHSWAETFAGSERNEPRTEQGANLGMWAELSGVPAALLTDPRVRWEPVDEGTALLVVPYGTNGSESFTVRFDPETGLVTHMEVMRYQKKDSPQKILWVTDALAWGTLSGYTTNVKGSAWWYGARRPWAIFRTEDVLLNADLSDYMGRRGE